MVRGARYALKITKPPGGQTSDSKGFPVVGAPATSEVRGSCDVLSAREIERAAALGVTAEAAARVPRGTDIDAASTLEVLDGLPQPDPEIAGVWHVSAVQHTRPHLRVLLRRTA